jgi:hypothetical protein
MAEFNEKKVEVLVDQADREEEARTQNPYVKVLSDS